MKHSQSVGEKEIEEKKYSLSKLDSQALKGIAIFFMLFAHCYRSLEKFGSYAVNTYPFTASQLIAFSKYSKICVSIFAFISGYGLYESYKRKQNSVKDNKWVKDHLVSTLSGYWFIAVLAYPIVFIVKYFVDNKNILLSYGSNWLERIAEVAADVLGLSSILGTKSLNGTWWYMGAAILFVVLAPLFARLLDKSRSVPVFILIALIPRVLKIGYPGGLNGYSFLGIFLAGMILNRTKFFEWVGQKYEKHKVLITIGLAAVLLFGVYSYNSVNIDTFWEYQFVIVPLTVIVFSKLVLFRFSVLQKIFMFFGKHSLNIWLLHTFFRDLTPSVVWGSGRWFAFPPIIMLLLSLVCSIIIEFIKKLLNYPGCLKKHL